ncbi:MAG: hypothetical protein J1F39_03990 [Clostridiales bacterium]|nr:hypothetical protein [Clostridiales bacterium]
MSSSEADYKKKEGINETAVEAFILSLIALVIAVSGFIKYSSVLTPLGFLFCALAIILSIYSLAEMTKYKRWNGLPFAIVAVIVGVLVPVVVMVIRTVLNMPLTF